ncbi:nucleotidyltransferase family protein [Candidatus Amarobacter glycogenicus]|uniref:nucleotidyltransferase family protein n=1 Tax=Candidatus Amarobacter glycogenicus TaxID=3140699 RepID=UPI0031370D26|nr:nucleotidyltransferase family protein [Dehalococcoidia bacterium]
MKLREPTPTQRAALGAALLPAPAAFEAWRRLQDLTGSLDAMDAATFRNLPMVYRNLKDAGLGEDELGQLKGIYRQAWYRNRLAVSAALRAVATLRAAGVEPIALKGLGLIATAYPEPALRPMHDVDLLIRPPGFMKAAGALLNAGWQPLRGDREDYFRRIRVFHALPLASPDSVEVDLHRYMLEENCWPDVDSSLFEHLAKGRVGDDALTTLRSEDHVINACVHGTRWDPVPSLRWVVDTVVVVRAAGRAFDWEYLVRQSVRRSVTLSMAAALEFAADYEPSIPGPTIEELRRVPPGRLQRLDFRAQQAGYGAGFQVLRYLTRYARLSSGRSLYRKAADFPTYLECMWELDRPRQVPLEGLRRVFRRLRRRLAAPRDDFTAVRSGH